MSMSKKNPIPILSKGDKVRLVFTDEVGIVLEQLDRETVLIDVAGSDIPAFIEHLELLSPVSTTENRPKMQLPPIAQTHVIDTKIDKKPQKLAEISILKQQADNLPDNGLLLLMQPFWRKDGIIDYFLLHFVNQSGKPIEVNYQMYLDTHSNAVFEWQKKVGGRENIILNSLQYDDLNENPEMFFAIKLLIADKDADYEPMLEKSIRPKARMLRNEPIGYDVINGKAYTHEICRQWPQKKAVAPAPALKKEEVHPILERIKQFEAEQARKDPSYGAPKVVINARQRVVDLHIEKLLPSYKHLKNGEILHIQIAHFEKELREAIRLREPNMIVIHGHGKGKLRQEIVNVLRQYPEICNFDNSYDHRFGFGATLIEMIYL